MKQVSIFVIFICVCNLFASIYCYPKTFVDTKNFMKLPEASVYWKGWVKYFHYNNGTHYERPTAFFQNNAYFAQRIPMRFKDKTDQYGTLRIPNRSAFFLVLYKQSLSIFSSRYNTNSKVYDTLKVDHINLVPEDKNLQGGIKDLGNFDEGKCIELEVSIPRQFHINFTPINNYNGRKQMWIICSEKAKDKNNLLTTLLKLKLKSQRKHGAVMTVDSIKNRKKGKKTLGSVLPKKPKKDPLAKPVDGYWIMLQDWTDCTLKCGGGKSYQQFMCVPPKNGGKKCKGQSIKSRSCNTQKCPHVGSVLKMRLLNLAKQEKKSAVPTPIKVAPISNRPQRYSKCIIKETDAFWTQYNEATRETKKQPVRILMNNKTLSIFADDDYENKIYTYNIDTSSIYTSKEFCCVKFQDTFKQFKLCGFPANCGTRLNNKWANQWVTHFNFFKRECKTGFKEQGILSDDDEKSLDNAFSKSMGDASADLKEELIAEKQKLILKNVRKAEKNKLERKVAQTENLGFKVLTKEADLENLISKEEKDKEAKDMKTMIDKIKKEKRKRKCLKKTLNQRKKDTEILLERRQGEQEIDEIRKEVKLEVEMKRNQMKRQIEQLRKRARIRKAALQTQLNKIKSQMAKDILMANRDGDMELCRKGKDSLNSRDAYCNANFIDDYIKNFDCKKEENFCYNCCEHEYGDNFLDKRDVCYDMCDGKKAKRKLRSKSKEKARVKKIAKMNGKSSQEVKKLGAWVWKKQQNTPNS